MSLALTVADRADAAALLVAAPVAGRTAAVAALRFVRPARAGGMGADARAGATAAAIAAGIVLSLLAALVAFGLAGGVLAAAGIAAGIGVAWWIAGRLGGLTGDVCGAAIEIGETAALLAGAALLQHGVGAFPRWGLP